MNTIKYWLDTQITFAKQQERALKRKLELIEYKGGKCECCGYNQNYAALDFHHVHPEEKEFQLDSRHLSNTHIDKLKKEVDKCVLLCANCHRESHHPEYSKDKVQLLLENYTAKTVKVLDKKHKLSVCPVCGKTATGNFCGECGAKKPAEPTGWTCACGTVNQGRFCVSCGKEKPADAPLYKCDKCGWMPEDPKNPPKFCPQCGDIFDDHDIQ